MNRSNISSTDEHDLDLLINPYDGHLARFKPHDRIPKYFSHTSKDYSKIDEFLKSMQIQYLLRGARTNLNRIYIFSANLRGYALDWFYDFYDNNDMSLITYDEFVHAFIKFFCKEMDADDDEMGGYQHQSNHSQTAKSNRRRSKPSFGRPTFRSKGNISMLIKNQKRRACLDNQLCFKCNASGHMQRNCPLSGTKT